MNKIVLPQVNFKNIIADGKRVEVAYSRIFNIARRNILIKRQLTNAVSSKYTEVQYEKGISNSRRGGKNAES